MLINDCMVTVKFIVAVNGLFLSCCRLVMVKLNTEGGWNSLPLG